MRRKCRLFVSPFRKVEALSQSLSEFPTNRDLCPHRIHVFILLALLIVSSRCCSRATWAPNLPLSETIYLTTSEPGLWTCARSSNPSTALYIMVYLIDFSMRLSPAASIGERALNACLDSHPWVYRLGQADTGIQAFKRNGNLLATALHTIK